MAGFDVQQILATFIKHPFDFDFSMSFVNVLNFQIYSLKALVKSFLPKMNAHQRTRLPGLLKVLVKILACGKIADDMKTRSAST